MIGHCRNALRKNTRNVWSCEEIHSSQGNSEWRMLIVCLCSATLVTVDDKLVEWGPFILFPSRECLIGHCAQMCVHAFKRVCFMDKVSVAEESPESFPFSAQWFRKCTETRSYCHEKPAARSVCPCKVNALLMLLDWIWVVWPAG